MVRKRLDIRPLAGAIGAEIAGIDLARELDADTVAAIRKVWLDHLVIFFRDQDLPPARLLALADRLHGEDVGGAEKVLRPIRRRRIGLLAAAGAVVGMLLAGPAIADPSPAAAITEWDRLAADPDDPNREGPGVALDKICLEILARR